MAEIRKDNLQGAEIAAFLQQHLDDMRAVSPPESRHALDLEGLRAPNICFWTLWDNSELVGCIALQELDAKQGELKSMRIAGSRRGAGLGRQLLEHIIDEARQRGYKRLLLETGSMPYFAPARSLYECFGFRFRGPFSKYVEDPNSVFMQLDLNEATG